MKLLLLLLLISTSVFAGYNKKTEGFYLKHFAEVQEYEIGKCQNFDGRLFRGGSPDLKDTKWINKLKEAKIEMVIDLRSEAINIDTEKKIVENAGMQYIIVPLSTTKNSQLVKDLFLKTVEDVRTSKLRTFIHCQRGEDRTGVFIASLRDCPYWKKEFKDYGGVLYPALAKIIEN